jgi:hypothetical protein
MRGPEENIPFMGMPYEMSDPAFPNVQPIDPTVESVYGRQAIVDASGTEAAAQQNPIDIRTAFAQLDDFLIARDDFDKKAGLAELLRRIGHEDATEAPGIEEQESPQGEQ